MSNTKTKAVKLAPATEKPLTKLEQVALQLMTKASSSDGISADWAKAIMGEDVPPSPKYNTLERAKWWITAEAKLAFMQAEIFLQQAKEAQK